MQQIDIAAYEAAFRHAAVGMCVAVRDATGLRIAAVNPALCETAGRTQAELLADGIRYLELDDVVDSGDGRPDDTAGNQRRSTAERRLVRGDGRTVSVQVQATPLPDGGSTLVEIRDITTQQRRERHLRTQRGIARVLGQSVTLEGGIPALLPELGPALEADVAVAWLIDRQDGTLRAQGTWCSSRCEGREFARLSRALALAPGVCLPGRVWESGEVETIDDIGDDGHSPRATAAAQDGLRGALALPLLAGTERLGVIELVSREGGRPDYLTDMAAALSADIGGMLASKRVADTPRQPNEILLVEDNAFIAEVISETLRSDELNFQVTHCERLSAARERLLRSRPACVLLDLTLPDADGLQALIELRDLAPDMPIVILTGHEDEQLAVQAMKEGAQDYLMKRRVDLHSLSRAIRYGVERERAQQNLLERALHDDLSGLPNRALFLDRLRVALLRGEASGTASAVVLVNIDRFRLVNETVGAATADRLLVDFASRLTGVVRRGTTIASFGPDEFAVLLEGISDERAAISLATRLREAVCAPFALDGEQVRITATVGVAITSGADEPEQLVQNADTAVSRGKELGGDRLEVFDEAVRGRMRERMLIETGLHQAIERDELRVHYQPIVSLETGGPVAIEALVRWEHPDRGMLMPGDFMGVAEETGAIIAVGEWVLRESCAEMVRLRKAGSAGPELQVNVNLSSRQLTDPSIVAKVDDALKHTGLSPDALCLEVTESSVIHDIDASSVVLQDLCELGVTLALDDFGTGYSSLSYLQRLPMQVLKLDKSFVAGLDVNERDTAIVTAIASLAPRLGLTTVAEGVETEGQAERLRAIGYTVGQGFHFARAMPAGRIADALASLTASRTTAGSR